MDKKLAMKIYNVMCDSEAIEKKMTVGKGSNSYKAIGEADVLNAIKPLLKKHKLIIIPIDVEITEHINQYTKSNTYNGKTTTDDKARLMTQLKVKWKIIDAETGEFEILASPGNGADPQDKASGKAWTYAYKVLIQKTFMLFSGDDTDNTHSDDIDKAPEEPIEPETPKTFEKEIKALKELVRSKGRTEENLKSRVKSMFSKELEELTGLEIERLAKGYNAIKEEKINERI